MGTPIEGLDPEELLALPAEEVDALILTGEPVSFQAGSAEVLGLFEIRDGRLVLELAHIDGGGEGVLPTLASLARRFAARRSLTEIEWIVYATNCANPKPKLHRVLERRGFEVRTLEGKGDCYYRRQSVD